MIDYLKGRLIEKNPAYVIIECNGIGYLVNISLQTYSHLKDKTEFKLFTHLTFRIDATTPSGYLLFGFSDKQERQLFKLLISVSGVGNSTAMLMLSSLTADKIYSAIHNGEISVLQSAKGIGPKTAKRIIIDLQDKVSRADTSMEFLKITHNTKKDEALIGLTILGFHKVVAEKALIKILKINQDCSVEQLIKEALKML